MRRQLEEVRKWMEEEGIACFATFLSDDHDSEYVSEHFKYPTYLSGFTGSNATVVVGRKEAALFTDGRYFVQADQELLGSGISLMRMGEPETPSLMEYLLKLSQSPGKVVIDGEYLTQSMGRQVIDHLSILSGKEVVYDEHFIRRAWKDRPDIIYSGIWELPLSSAGRTRSEKLAAVRKAMAKANCRIHLLTSLDDIAWLTNLRANDISCNPYFYSYCLLTKEDCFLYLNKKSLSRELQETLEQENITVCEYTDFETDFSNYLNQHPGEKILADSNRVSYLLWQKMKDRVMDQTNPTLMLKALKNEVEIEASKAVHLEDGVCVTRLMHFVKTRYDQQELREQDAADYVDHLRSQITDYIELSFDTISAYGSNGAMMHYNHNKGDNRRLEGGSFLLVDSGGHYMRGTTDITRTFALGQVSEQMKHNYTLTLKAWLHLMHAKFLAGATGVSLDYAARGIMWQEGVDYKCGTGHGVGHVLGVHESPNAFRYRVSKDLMPVAIVPGMVTTDEPGVYLEGQYGIRIENELLCVPWKETEHGIFYQFENLTYAPIDLDAVEKTDLTDEELMWLNNYQKAVYEHLAPLMSEEECNYLREYTRAL